MVFFYYPLRTFLVSPKRLQDLTMKAGKRTIPSDFFFKLLLHYVTNDMCAEVID